MNPDKPTPRRGVPTQELGPVLAEQQNEDPGHLPPLDDQSEGIVKRWVLEGRALEDAVRDPPPVEPATAYRLLKQWLDLPDRYKPRVQMRLPGAPGCQCQTGFIEWLTHNLRHGLYALLKEIAPDDAERFRTQAYRVMEYEARWFRENHTTGLAWVMSRGLARILPKFVDELFA